MHRRLVFAAFLLVASLFRPPCIHAQVYEKVYDFTIARAEEISGGLSRGGYPKGGLIQGSDRNFYGTTKGGGASDCGTVFKITPSGELTTLVEFTGDGLGNKGSFPNADFVQGSDGNFYGTTESGGTFGLGTVFKVTPDGVLTTLVEFTGNGTSNKGASPHAGLVQGTDGNFYGTTTLGGASDKGTAFKMTPGGVLTTLVEFTGNGASNKGASPFSGLVQGSDGNFYGTTYTGGATNRGTVFKMTSGGVLTTLVEFTDNGASNRGAFPYAGLVQGSDGNFYGTTREGGASSQGTAFKMTPSGVLATLVEFTSDGTINKGVCPEAGLVQGIDGNFYGTTEGGGAFDYGTVFKMSPGGVLTTLVDLTGNGTSNKGASPRAGLVRGSDGTFYGTTHSGGSSNSGTLFKMTPGGVLTTLVEFIGSGTSSIGSFPRAGLLQGSDGSFYGTTREGGASESGTVFKITSGGMLTTLVGFTGNGPSNKGSFPSGELVQGVDGNFYGTTSGGGASDKGTVFKMTPGGVLTTLVEFTGNGTSNKGASPFAVLVKGSDGNFYGTTSGGGASNKGTVFKMTPGGVLTTLVEFTGNGTNNKGQSPEAGVVQGSDGNFYGTTREGGVNSLGTVFKMTPGGVLTTLVEFTGNGAVNKGYYPEAELIQGSDGNFYGTTTSGGATDSGTVFKMTPGGVLTTLVEFTGNGATNRGYFPEAALVQGSDGNFYGTTNAGGAFGKGTVFKVTSSGLLTTLVEFTAAGEGHPYGTLVRGSDGCLYGTGGGIDGTSRADGSIYRLIFPGAPLVSLVSLQPPGQTGAILEGKVNPRGASTNVTLEYGSDGINFGAPVPLVNGISGYQTKPVGTTIENLAPGTTYYYRIRAVSSAGTMVSPVQSFSTLAEPVAATTLASEIAQTSARFNGTVNAGNFETTVLFEWGTNGNSFPNTATAVPGTVTGNTNVAVSAAVAGLVKGQTYYYRITATNAAGTVTSGVQSFITLTEPVATAGSATVHNAGSASVSGTVDARGASTNTVFEYATNASFNGSLSISASPSPVTGVGTTPVNATLTGLTAGTTYWYRVIATSSGGTGSSSAGTFTTLSLPGANLLAAESVNSLSAVLKATVDAKGLNTTVVFEYGPNQNSFPISVAAAPSQVSGSGTTNVAASINGLTPETTYYYRVRATSSAGTSIGGPLSFTTRKSANVTTVSGLATLDGATLVATVDGFGQTTSVFFDYGTDPELLTVDGTVPGNQQASAETNVSAFIPVGPNLVADTTYYFRARAQNQAGTTLGSVKSFKTQLNHDPAIAADVVFYSGQVRFNPLENDSDSDVATGVDPNLVIAPQLMRQPSDSGSKALVAQDGKSITYTPGNDSSGEDSLAYRALDSYGGKADGEVRLIDFFLLAGYYSGVIPSSGGGGEGTAIALQLGAGGVISTSFMGFDAERYPLKGTFGSNGRLSATFAKVNTPGSTVTLTFQLLPDRIVVNNRSVRAINATFQETVNGVPSQEMPFTLIEGIATGVMGGGRLTAHIERNSVRAVSDAGIGEVAEAVSVGGDGYVVMTIGKDKLRRARVVGRLPDGEPFSSGAMAPFGKTYQLAATNLYRRGKGGTLAGRINVLTDPDDTATTDTPPAPLGMLSDLSWRRRASFADRAYPFGIASRLALEGLFYPEFVPNGLQGILGNTATLTLSGAGLPVPSAANNNLQVGLMIVSPTVVQVAEPNPLKVKFKANSNTALYTGSFIHPTTRKLVKFSGAIQAAYGSAPASGRGCFLSNGVSGSARVDANP